MTRDQKLALIVGFSVVLLVGVLISDHLSQARQSKVASVQPSEPVRVAQTPTAPPPRGLPASLTSQPADPLPSDAELRARSASLWPETAKPLTPITPTGSLASNQTPAVTPAPSGMGMSGTMADASTAAPRQSLADGLQVAGADKPALETPLATPEMSIPSAPATTEVASKMPEGTLADEIRAQGGSLRQNGDVIEFTLTNTRKDRLASKPVTTPAPAPSAAVEAQPPSIKSDPVLAMGEIREHQVAKGDTLQGIAKKYYSDTKMWKQLAAYNGSATKPDGTIRVGSKLRIPPKDELTLGSTAKSPATKPATPAAPSSEKAKTPARIPASGSAIASATKPASNDKPAAAKTPVTKVAAADSKTDSKASAKKTEKAETKVASSRPTTYTVRKGDTLSKIASRVLGSSRRVDDLLKANVDKLDDEDSVEAGMVLRVPQA